MPVRAARRIAQGFFLILLVWFCLVMTVGERWWELRGWPVNCLLQLDPLAALGIVLTTGTLYAGLAWAVVTILLTLLFGRVFCGWICPLGTMQQMIGWLARRLLRLRVQLDANVYKSLQRAKYYILVFLLAWAGCHGLARLIGLSSASLFSTTLPIGWLDPIPLVSRSFSLVLLPWAGHAAGAEPLAKYFEGSLLTAAIFVGILLLTFWMPRFYCRFICPLGALLGWLSQWSVFRFGKRTAVCSNCRQCVVDCEGACEPEGKIRTSECLACVNCLSACEPGEGVKNSTPHVMTFRVEPSSAGEVASPVVSRRGFVAALVAGAVAGPVAKLGALSGQNWNPDLIRPPGALREDDFLARCIQCGQCMRVCPTNIIHPALLCGGMESLWTPKLNFRIGTSGCQVDCTACGNVCPTAAIRSLTLDEKKGQGAFAARGPIRLGLAFVDRNRCLPWAMDLPCMVCQEVCPVSPKAILLREMPGGDTIGPLVGPVVNPELCIGCGICEHECPVTGLKAIRVTAENESRDERKKVTAKMVLGDKHEQT